MVSKMIDELNGRHILGGLNHNQIREIFQGFQYEIMSEIDGERGCRIMKAEKEDVYIGFTLRISQVNEWVSVMYLLL